MGRGWPNETLTKTSKMPTWSHREMESYQREFGCNFEKWCNGRQGGKWKLQVESRDVVQLCSGVSSAANVSSNELNCHISWWGYIVMWITAMCLQKPNFILKESLRSCIVSYLVGHKWDSSGLTSLTLCWHDLSFGPRLSTVKWLNFPLCCTAPLSLGGY